MATKEGDAGDEQQCSTDGFAHETDFPGPSRAPIGSQQVKVKGPARTGQMGMLDLINLHRAPELYRSVLLPNFYYINLGDRNRSRQIKREPISDDRTVHDG